MATPNAVIYYELDKLTPHCVIKLRILRYWITCPSNISLYMYISNLKSERQWQSVRSPYLDRCRS